MWFNKKCHYCCKQLCNEIESKNEHCMFAFHIFAQDFWATVIRSVFVNNGTMCVTPHAATPYIRRYNNLYGGGVWAMYQDLASIPGRVNKSCRRRRYNSRLQFNRADTLLLFSRALLLLFIHCCDRWCRDVILFGQNWWVLRMAPHRHFELVAPYSLCFSLTSLGIVLPCLLNAENFLRSAQN